MEGSLATLSGGSLKTDTNGSGFFELLYPASNALWSYVEIVARAEALGVEATDSYRTILAMPAAAIKAKDDVPANALSPYGTEVTNTVIRMGQINDLTMPIFGGCTNTF